MINSSHHHRQFVIKSKNREKTEKPKDRIEYESSEEVGYTNESEFQNNNDLEWSFPILTFKNVKQNICIWIRRHGMILSVLISIILGFLIASLLKTRKEPYNEFESFLIAFPGLFYMRIMRGVLMPLIIISIISNLGLILFLEQWCGNVHEGCNHHTEVVYIGLPLTDDKLRKSRLDDSKNWWTREITDVGFANYVGLITIEQSLLTIADWFQWYSQIGRFFLLLEILVNLKLEENPMLNELFHYSFTFCLTVFIHLFIIIPIHFLTFTELNPCKNLRLMPGITILYGSFTTSSSLISIPTTINWLERRANIEAVLARLFTIIGAVISKDGSAIWMTVTTIFVCQVTRLDLNFWDVAIIWYRKI
uniref:Amino acid transporter n=1 Tax=Strigamia maritima TaxID=126957 RepID=T1JEB2_STRMM